MKTYDWEYLPCNGQEGQACPNGCIMKKDKNTGKLYLIGDCRAPYDKDCALEVQEREQYGNHQT